jgi:hypothetical protein
VGAAAGDDVGDALLTGVAAGDGAAGLVDWVVGAAACGFERGWFTKAKPHTATTAATRPQTAITRGEVAERRDRPLRAAPIVTGTSGRFCCSDVSSPDAVALSTCGARSHGTHISTLPRARSTTNGRLGSRVGLPGVTLGNSSHATTAPESRIEDVERVTVPAQPLFRLNVGLVVIVAIIVIGVVADGAVIVNHLRTSSGSTESSSNDQSGPGQKPQHPCNHGFYVSQAAHAKKGGPPVKQVARSGLGKSGNCSAPLPAAAGKSDAQDSAGEGDG